MIYISHNNQVISNADRVFAIEKDINNQVQIKNFKQMKKRPSNSFFLATTSLDKIFKKKI